MKKTLCLITTLALAGGILCTSFAQEGLANLIIAARKANYQLMLKYSWTSRTEMIENGQVEDVRIESVVYGPNSQLQRSILNDQEAALPRGFLRRRIAEQRRAHVEKYLVGLRKLLDQYTLPAAGKVSAFVSTATIQAPDANGLLKLTGAGVILPADTYNLWVDATTRQTRKIQITTVFEGDEVTVSASFSTLPSGLTHPEYGEVDVPAKKIQVQLHNYNYNANN